MSLISNILSHDISQAVFGILRLMLMHICSIGSYFFHAKANEARLSYVYPCVSLINQVLVTGSFTILHRRAQLWNAVSDFITFFSYLSLCMKFNTFFIFIKLSFFKNDTYFF